MSSAPSHEKFTPSVGILKLKITEWFAKTKRARPFFADEPAMSLGITGTRDVVLMGDFVFNILDCLAWGKSSYRIWVLSERVREALHVHSGVPRECIGVIPRFELFPPGNPQTFPSRGEPWTLVYSGRILSAKNPLLALFTARLLREKYGEKVRLAACGPTPAWISKSETSKRFRELLAETNGRDADIFLGDLGSDWVSSVSGDFKNPVFFSLSTYPMEDFGLSLAQAQSRGWPSIVSDWGGHGEARLPNALSIPSYLLPVNASEPEHILRGRAHGCAEFIAKNLMRARAHRLARVQSAPSARHLTPVAITRAELRVFRSALIANYGLKSGPSRKFRAIVTSREIDAYVFCEKQRVCFSGSALPRARIAVVKPWRRSEWLSVREILRGREQAWAAAGRSDTEVRFYTVEKSTRAEVLKALMSADAIVFCGYSRCVTWLVHVLRSGFGFKGTFLFHTHGESVGAAFHYHKTDPFLKKSDVFLCGSSTEKAALHHTYPEVRARTIPHFIPDLFISSKRKTSLKKVGPLPLLYVGRIAPEKRIHVLLEAVAKVRTENPRLVPRLDLVGPVIEGVHRFDGAATTHYARDLRRLVRLRGLKAIVRWHGLKSQPDAARFISRAPHLFVSPSVHMNEDFGIMALRSCLADSRVVLSRWGGHRDLISRFNLKVNSVCVGNSSGQPEIRPADLAAAIKASQRLGPRPPGFRETAPYQLNRIASQLRRAALGPSPRKKGRILPSFDAVSFRRLLIPILHFKNRRQVPLLHSTSVQKYLKIYGMKNNVAVPPPHR